MVGQYTIAISGRRGAPRRVVELRARAGQAPETQRRRREDEPLRVSLLELTEARRARGRRS